MIDQHLVELQVHKLGRHNLVGGVAGDKMSSKKHIRGLSEISVRRTKHVRRRSDIDSLSPEVLRALQATLGGKLDEIRSKFQESSSSSPSPPLEPPLRPPPSSPPPPRIPDSPPPAPPCSSPPAPPIAAVERTFAERLADREGLWMLIAYFSSIFLASFVVWAADTASEDLDMEAEELRGGGRIVNDECARLYGHILPVGISSFFFILSLVLFVCTVSCVLFNIFTAAGDFLRRSYGDRIKWTKQSATDDTNGRSPPSTDDDDMIGGSSSSSLSAAGTLRLIMNHTTFILPTSALVWMSKTSTIDPLCTICEERLKVLWMLGLMIMTVSTLVAEIKIFRHPAGPLDSTLHHMQGACKTISVILLALIVATAISFGMYETTLDGRKNGPLQVYEYEQWQCKDCCEAPRAWEEQCDWPKVKQIQVYERKNRRKMKLSCNDCRGPRKCDNDLQCEWPARKRIQAYEHKSKSPTSFPQCDWPRAKEIQPFFQQQEWCAAGFPQCDWPIAKQLHTYEDQCPAAECTSPSQSYYEPRPDREQHTELQIPQHQQLKQRQNTDICEAEENIVLQYCDWPWLKQIQLFESAAAHDQCRLQRIQLFEATAQEDRCPCRRTDVRDDFTTGEYYQWPWVDVNSSKHPQSQNTCRTEEMNSYQCEWLHAERIKQQQPLSTQPL